MWLKVSCWPSCVSIGAQMIMAKVLVGRYTCGSPTMKRPPKISPAGDRTYDSTVNDQHMPTIFVSLPSRYGRPDFSRIRCFCGLRRDRVAVRRPLLSSLARSRHDRLLASCVTV